MSDARSRSRTAEWRLRHRKLRRRERVGRQGLDTDPAFDHEGSTAWKIDQMCSRARHLTEELADGKLSTSGREIARSLQRSALSEWNFADVLLTALGPDCSGDRVAGPDCMTLQDVSRMFADRGLDLKPGAYAVGRRFQTKCYGRRYELVKAERADRDPHFDPRYEYVPGPLRSVYVAKDGRPGKRREIRVANLTDWMIEKALIRTVGPLLERELPDNVVGFRKGIGHLDALARVLGLAKQRRANRWLLADIRNAFPSVRHDLLEPVLKKLIPNPFLVELSMAIESPDRTDNGQPGRGLHQGSTLSPALLNAYLAEHLDLPWAEQHPQWPLVRYADDIIVLTRSKAEARAAHRALATMLARVGMELAAHKTRNTWLDSKPVAWLGHTISRGHGYRIGLPHDFRDQILRTLERKDRTMSVEGRMAALFAYHGPVWDHEDIEYWTRKTEELAAERDIPIDGLALHRLLGNAASAETRRWRDMCRDHGLPMERRDNRMAGSGYADDPLIPNTPDTRPIESGRDRERCSPTPDGGKEQDTQDTSAANEDQEGPTPVTHASAPRTADRPRSGRSHIRHGGRGRTVTPDRCRHRQTCSTRTGHGRKTKRASLTAGTLLRRRSRAPP